MELPIEADYHLHNLVFANDQVIPTQDVILHLLRCVTHVMKISRRIREMRIRNKSQNLNTE